jgi:hypothetical protein
MGVITIREAERAGARLVLGIAGISGSGKTYTALQLAYGLANGNAKKVALLDSENRRGSLYADVLKNKKGEVQRFLIGDLYAPFSPQRYADAIMEFQAAGVEVLVIDSISHEHEGEGGLEDIAHEGNPKNPRWNEAKRLHKRMMNTLLQCDMHIICTMRAREKVKLVKRDGKMEYEPQGVLPICEKNFPYELTASMLMWNGGRSRDVMKCPEELVPIFGKAGETADGYLTARHGLMLRQWIDGGSKLEPAVEHARNTLRTITEQGVDAVRKLWDVQAEPTRKALGAAYLQELLEAAEAFDEQRKLAASGEGAQLDDLNSQVLGGGTGGSE